MRTHTPCGARFLVNQRSEGTLTSLTGRMDLAEGMGPFLRPSKIPYVDTLMLNARKFYLHPQSNEAVLRQYGITYVVVAKVYLLLGYSGPESAYNLHELNTTPFLHEVFKTPTVIVYRVAGAPTPPPSPLLKGPYLHCLTKPAHL